MAGRQYWWNPWDRERRTYLVALGPTDCRELLKAGTTIWLSAPVARVVLTGDDLWLYRATFYRNGSKPYAHIRFRPTAGGTAVEVTIGLRPISRIVVAGWFGIGLFWTSVAFYGAVSSASWNALILPLLGVALVGFGLLIFAFGRLLARRDPEILRAYIEARLAVIPGTTASA
jgi:hypothetical protein